MKKSLKDNILTLGHNFVIKYIYRFLSDKQVNFCEYFIIFGKLPNLKDPKTFNEKLQWIKIYGNIEKYTKYVDKLEVRDFISKKIGKEYLIPLIGVWKRFEDIPLDKLPKKFVLKGTHGSGYIFVCKDKSSLDMKALNRMVTKWVKEDFYKKTREINYKFCKPMIVCETYLENRLGELPDYKFLCFNGKPKAIELVWDRFTEHKKEVFLNFGWNTLTYLEPSFAKRLPKKPKNFNEMLRIAEKLSKGFPFVRVDLYSVNNKIYFGELTFTPDNGLEKFNPAEVDCEFGKLIDLSKYSNKK